MIQVSWPGDLGILAVYELFTEWKHLLATAFERHERIEHMAIGLEVRSGLQHHVGLLQVRIALALAAIDVVVEANSDDALLEILDLSTAHHADHAVVLEDVRAETDERAEDEPLGGGPIHFLQVVYLERVDYSVRGVVTANNVDTGVDVNVVDAVDLSGHVARQRVQVALTGVS